MGIGYEFILGVGIGFEFLTGEASKMLDPDARGGLMLDLVILRLFITI